MLRARRRPLRISVLVVCALVVAAVVAAAATASPSNTVAPTVTGEFSDGGSLSADPGSWSGSGSLSYAYQWQDCASYSATVLGDGPSGYWRLDDKANPDGAPAAVLDSTSNHFNGTYSGSPTLGASGVLAGDLDTAASFSGTGQFASVSGTFPTGRSAVSLEAWYKPSALPAATELVLGYGDATVGDDHQFFVGVNTNKLILRYGSAYKLGTTTLSTNTWYYIVAEDTGTALNVYLNGSATPDITVATPYSGFSKANGQTQIGEYVPGSGAYADGTIDEAAIYPSALTTTQIAAHYQAATSTTGSSCSAIAGATDQVYTPQSSDVGQRIRVEVTATDSSGSAAADSLATLVQSGGPTNLVTPKIFGDPEQGQMLTANQGLWSGLPQSSSPTYQWQRCGYQTAVLADYPESYFRLGEAAGPTAADLGSYHAIGTYVGSPTFGQTGALSGDPNTAVTFNGAGQNMTFSSGSSYPTGRAPASIEAWVKLPTTVAGTAVGGYGDTTVNDKHAFGIDFAGSPLKARIQTNGNSYTGVTTITPGDWYYVAAVDDGTNLELYVNGRLDGTFAPISGFSKADALAEIGGIPGMTNSLTAAVDEFAIYGYALSADQVATHYQAGVQELAGFGCQDIPGAAGSFDAFGVASYTVTSADNGAKLRVKVVATNSDGSSEADSDLVIVSTAAPTVEAAPAISGSTAVGATLTAASGDWAGTQPIAYTYQWSTCGYQDVVLADHPVAYLRLGDDPNQLVAVDSSGNGNNGALTTTLGATGQGVLGAVGALPGDGDTSALFATGDYVTIPDSSAIDPTSGYSVEAWLRPPASGPPTTGLILTKVGASAGWALKWGGTAGELVATVGTSGGGISVFSNARLTNPNHWYHVVLSVGTGANGTAKLYVDGALDSSQAYTGSLNQNASVDLKIGDTGVGVDEFAFYDAALTATQVSNHFNAAACQPINGETNATHVVSSADQGKRLSVMVTASNVAGNASSSSQTFQVTGGGAPVNSVRPLISGDWSIGQSVSTDNGTWESGDPLSYSYQWQRCTYAQTILADQPAAYWPLDETGGPTVTDLSGNGVNATASAVTFGVPGALADSAGTAVQVGGAGSGIQAPNASVLNGDRSFSLEAWVRLPSLAGAHHIFDKGWYQTLDSNGNPVYHGDFEVLIDSTGHIVLLRSDGTGGTVLMTSTGALTPGAWHHVVVTRGSNLVHMYLDGVDVSGQLVSNIAFEDSTEPLEIGRDANGGGNAFSGDLDEIAVYPAQLSASQVQAHYAAGQASCTNVSGQTTSSYTLSSADIGTQVRVKVTATDQTTQATATASSLGTYLAADTSGANLEPGNGADVATVTPLLSRSVVTGGQYEFELANDQNFSAGVKTSAWQSANSFTVPSTWHLADKHTYYWHVRTQVGSVVSGWAGPNQLIVQLAPTGMPSYWAMWKSGPLAVNLANGNLVFSPPTPSFPTASGTMAASMIYNSLDPSTHGFARGWLINGGNDFGAPPTLIDESVLGGDDDVIVTWPDGSTSVFNHIAGSSGYKSPPGDPSTLSTDGASPAGSYTLVDANGSIYTYGAADPTSGQAKIETSDIVDAQPGKATLTYTLDSYERITKITDDGGRTLTFTWPDLNTCTTCYLQITGPDGVNWRYNYTSGELTSISDGTRTLYQFGYDANYRLTAIKNADDVANNSAHAITISYDPTSGEVSSVANGPITNQVPTTSTTTFNYACSNPQTAPVSASHHIPSDGYPWDPGYRPDGTTLVAGAVRTAVGCTTVTSPNGGTTTTYYDGFNHPMETVDALGRITQEEYNAKDQLLWTEDANGNPTDYTYDPVTDSQLTVTGPDPDGNGPLGRPVTQSRYDETSVGTATTAGTPLQGLQGNYYTNINLAGRPLTRTDANVNFNWGAGGPSIIAGAVSNFSIRWTGLLTVPQTGAYTLMTDATAGTRLSIDDQQVISNWTTQPLTLAESEPIKLTQGEHKISLDYYVTTGAAQVALKWRCPGCANPISSQVIPSSDLLPNWANQTTTIDPLGRISFSHFANPQLAHPDYTLALLDTADPASPANDPTTSFLYDAYGRVTKKVMPKGNQNRTIDAQGNLSGSPINKYATVYSYYAPGETVNSINQAEQLKSESQYGLAANRYSYDAAGRTLTKTNGRGTTTYSYDSEGRLTSEQAPGDTQATTFTYDPNGAQLTATDASGTITTQYDEAGRTTQTTDSFGATSSYSYDADGNTVSRVATPIPGGAAYTTGYGYDAGDELTSETDPAGRQWQIFYDSRGNLHAIQYPNGTFTWTDLNAAGWTTHVYNRHGNLSAPLPSTAPADGLNSPIADYSYSYNQAGQKTQETRTAGSTVQTSSYQYDPIGRLSQATLPNGTVRQYAFDLDSNRTSITDNGIITASYSYNPSITRGVDELTSAGSTSYAYNGDGEVTSCGANTLNWDGWQRLAGATFGTTTINYGYDASGALRSRNAGAKTTDYLLGDLYETDGAGTITASYIDGPAGNLAQYSGPPTTGTTVSFLYYNAHGDLAAEADTTGTSTANHTYSDPFGAPVESQPANSTVHLYTGRWNKQYDTTSGLILMGARPYDPTLGRFLAVDPIDGGSLNNYDYAGQDPVNGYDLKGTTRWCNFGLGGCGTTDDGSWSVCAWDTSSATDWTCYTGLSLTPADRKNGMVYANLTTDSPVGGSNPRASGTKTEIYKDGTYIISQWQQKSSGWNFGCQFWVELALGARDPWGGIGNPTIDAPGVPAAICRAAHPPNVPSA